MHISSDLLKEPLKADDYTSWIAKHRKQHAVVQESAGAQQVVRLELF